MNNINNRNIKASVTRKNNKTRKNYPLFFDEFKTDFDNEKQNKIDATIETDILFDLRKDKQDLLWFKIEWYKRILLHLNKSDIIEDGYKMWAEFHHHQNCCLSDSLCRGIAEIMGWVPCEVEKKAEIFGIKKPY